MPWKMQDFVRGHGYHSISSGGAPTHDEPAAAGVVEQASQAYPLLRKTPQSHEPATAPRAWAAPVRHGSTSTVRTREDQPMVQRQWANNGPGPGGDVYDTDVDQIDESTIGSEATMSAGIQDVPRQLSRPPGPGVRLAMHRPSRIVAENLRPMAPPRILSPAASPVEAIEEASALEQSESEDEEDMPVEEDPTMTFTKEQMAEARRETDKVNERRRADPPLSGRGRSNVRAEAQTENQDPPDQLLELRGHKGEKSHRHRTSVVKKALDPSRVHHQGTQAPQSDDHNVFDASDLAEDDLDDDASGSPASGKAGGHGGPARHQMEPETKLDYSPATLSRMTYATLAAETFDEDPSATGPTYALSSAQAALPLSEQLSHMATQAETEQRGFCNALSTQTWEECGDWFVARFADHVARRTAARERRRNVARDFEEEIRIREEAVARKRAAVEGVLVSMKKGGNAVLRRNLT
ncbi:MAG: hypothetical protein M1838_004525 [Thelocarpon superellum]|nr:MAG: hypothetical protein M1838_004525 [Thelocarpon superellum]